MLLLAAALSRLTATSIKDVGVFFKTQFTAGGYPLEIGISAKTVKTMSSAYCVQSGNTIAVVSNGGALLQTIRTPYYDTSFATSGNKLLVWAVNGNKASLYNRTSQLFEYSTDNVIISGDVSHGRAALLTASDRYAAQLTVYDEKARELFTWYCADGYPYMAAFSEDGKYIAAAAMYIENGVFKSYITLISVKDSSEVWKGTAESVVLKMYPGAKSLTAVGEKGIYLFNETGALTASADFGEIAPSAIERASNGNIAVALGDTSHRGLNRYFIFDSELALVAENDTGAAINDICLARDRIYILGETSVTCYSFDNELMQTITCSPATAALVMPRSGTLIAVMNGTAVKIK